MLLYYKFKDHLSVNWFDSQNVIVSSVSGNFMMEVWMNSLRSFGMVTKFPMLDHFSESMYVFDAVSSMQWRMNASSLKWGDGAIFEEKFMPEVLFQRSSKVAK